MKSSEIKKHLGLDTEATDEDVLSALDMAASIVSTFRECSEKLGLHAQSSPKEIAALLGKRESTAVSELRSELVVMSEEVSSLREEVLHAHAVNYVERMMTEKFINEDLKEQLISLHARGEVELVKSMISGLLDVPLNVFHEYKPPADNGTKNSPIDDEIKRNLA